MLWHSLGSPGIFLNIFHVYNCLGIIMEDEFNHVLSLLYKYKKD